MKTYKKVTIIFILLTSVTQLNAQQAAIATAHPVATRAGMGILQAGGNAFDAAVAVSATLAVVEPYSSGLGGGGFWLLKRTGKQPAVMIDGRETAPLKASRDMYLDKQGNVIKGLSINGPLAAGIPGEPAALVYIGNNYGRLPLIKSLAPAIRAARNGFKVTPHYQRMVKFRIHALRKSPAAAKIFLKNNEIPPLDYLIKQPDLANTLAAIANQGHAGFYAGAVAKALVKGNQQAGGIWQAKDLAQYKIKQRQPLVGYYKGYRITSVAPPSSGGVALLSMLNMLEGYNLREMKPAQRIHLITEVMRRAYHDRAEFLGDSDFVKVPVKRLISKSHANILLHNLNLNRATPSRELKAVIPVQQGNHTTHFSILDKYGNKVSATLSINYPFGSCFMPPGTGVLLNDEMDDFSSKPGVPNVYGLVGNQANAIEPGKRMLSSMSPTFVSNEHEQAIIGTPGGSRIITMVLHGILAFVAGKTAQQIVSQPRYHHQYLPDVIQIEPGALSQKVRDELQFKGHILRDLENTYGNMQVVVVRHGKVSAASDPRGEGLAIITN